jgi:hypothetical protein
MHRTSLATSVVVAAVLAGGALPAQAAIGTTPLSATGTGSAAAAAYPVADALAEIAKFTSDSQKAALSEGFTADLTATSDQAQAYKAITIVDPAGNQHVTASGDGAGGSFDSVSIAGVGTWIGIRGELWGSVFGKSAFKQALKYLKKSGATYVSMADPTTPKAAADSTGFADLTTDFTAKTVAKADKSSFGDSGGVRYTLVTKAKSKQPASTATIDVLDGRVVAESGDEDDAHLTATWTYGADDIATPGKAESVSFEDLLPAVEAATLPATLKSQATRIAKKVRTTARKAHQKVTPARIRHYAATITKKDNTDGRSIRTRTSKVKNGTRIFAKNPYTHKVVAYKITLVKGKVVVSKA